MANKKNDNEGRFVYTFNCLKTNTAQEHILNEMFNQATSLYNDIQRQMLNTYRFIISHNAYKNAETRKEKNDFIKNFKIEIKSQRRGVISKSFNGDKGYIGILSSRYGSKYPYLNATMSEDIGINAWSAWEKKLWEDGKHISFKSNEKPLKSITTRYKTSNKKLSGMDFGKKVKEADLMLDPRKEETKSHNNMCKQLIDEMNPNVEVNVKTKPEPKFKVGDKITNGKGIFTIVTLSSDKYSVEDSFGRYGFLHFKNQDEWEIVEEKDLDLKFKAGDRVFNKVSRKWVNIIEFDIETGLYIVRYDDGIQGRSLESELCETRPSFKEMKEVVKKKAEVYINSKTELDGLSKSLLYEGFVDGMMTALIEMEE